MEVSNCALIPRMGARIDYLYTLYPLVGTYFIGDDFNDTQGRVLITG